MKNKLARSDQVLMLKRKNLSKFLLFLCAWFLISCTEQEPASGTAISNVTVIDAINGVRKNQTVIFDGDKITTIQTADKKPAVAQVIDGEGKYLIPGLWDFHVHLTYDERLTASMPELFLSWGITSVRDTGGLMEKILPVVEAMRAEGAVAPRVFFSGPLLDGNPVVYNGIGRPEIGIQLTADNAYNTVKALKEQGVDFVKIYEMVSPKIFNAIVTAANNLNLPIDAHVPLSMRASVAGPKVDSIEHLRNIEMDCASNVEALLQTRLERLKNQDSLSGADLRSSLHTLQRMAAVEGYDEARCDKTIAALQSTMMVPTLRLNSFAFAPPYQRKEWQQVLASLPKEVGEAWAAQSERMAARPNAVSPAFGEWSLFLTGRMHEAGLPIGAGTDTPIVLAAPGYSLHSELEMLVRAGLSPLDALAAATIRPAEYFSLQNEMGTVEVGKRADLVLLDANPLADIRNTKTIATVISKGRVVN